jgi:hypothetical protein
MSTKGGFSMPANSREFGQRVSWVWQWMLMASIGAFVGWVTGGLICELLFLMFVKSAPDEWGFTIIQSLSGIYQITAESIALSVKTVTEIGKFGFAITFGLVLLHGQQLFVEILRIKLTHRMLYFPLRGTVPPEEFNVFSDYLWAVLYCVSYGLFPWVVFVVLFFVGLSVIPNTIDFIGCRAGRRVRNKQGSRIRVRSSLSSSVSAGNSSSTTVLGINAAEG